MLRFRNSSFLRRTNKFQIGTEAADGLFKYLVMYVKVFHSPFPDTLFLKCFQLQEKMSNLVGDSYIGVLENKIENLDTKITDEMIFTVKLFC